MVDNGKTFLAKHIIKESRDWQSLFFSVSVLLLNVYIIIVLGIVCCCNTPMMFWAFLLQYSIPLFILLLPKSKNIFDRRLFRNCVRKDSFPKRFAQASEMARKMFLKKCADGFLF